MTSARKFVEEAGRQFDQARAGLRNVRQRLLHPSAEALENALPELERAIHLLRQGLALLPAYPGGAQSSEAWESARQVRRELDRVRTLARQAAAFYSDRLNLLAGQDCSLRYNSDGAASAPLPEKQLEKDLVLHG